MKTRIIILVIVCLTLTVPVLAQSSTNYDLSWHVSAGGGGRMTSTGHMLLGTVGQPLVGTMAASSGHKLCSGFWCSGSWFASETGLYQIYLPVVLK
jgi:hypothetical protein